MKEPKLNTEFGCIEVLTELQWKLCKMEQTIIRV